MCYRKHNCAFTSYIDLFYLHDRPSNYNQCKHSPPRIPSLPKSLHLRKLRNWFVSIVIFHYCRSNYSDLNSWLDVSWQLLVYCTSYWADNRTWKHRSDLHSFTCLCHRIFNFSFCTHPRFFLPNLIGTTARNRYLDAKLHDRSSLMYPRH